MFESAAPLREEFARLDWRLYMRTIRAMARHDAWDALASLDVPTLVVGGTRDLFLPKDTVRAIAARVPDADLCVVVGASHYLPLEFPDLLDERIREFEADRLPHG